MADYDSIDLDWTWDGDYFIGQDGDLADTESNLLQSLENEIRTIVKSEFDDWEKHPDLGSNLSEFRGEPNSRKIGRAIEQQLTSRIIATGIILPEDLNVRVVPVHVHRVLIMINVSVVSTPGNALEPGSPLVVNLIYDSLEDGIFFLLPNQVEDAAFFT